MKKYYSFNIKKEKYGCHSQSVGLLVGMHASICGIVGDEDFVLVTRALDHVPNAIIFFMDF